MPKSFAEYGIERGAPSTPATGAWSRTWVAAADAEVDFRSYDLLNVLVTPNAGPSALDTSPVRHLRRQRGPGRRRRPGVHNASFVYSRQDDGSGSYDETGYRVLPHENSHVFGLPDLYTQEGGGAVGHWDIMSEDWGASNDLLGWHKWKLGWLDPPRCTAAAAPGTTSTHSAPLADKGAATSWWSSHWTAGPATP